MSKKHLKLRSPKESKRKLKRIILLFFLIIAIPAYLLISRAYQQLEVETFIDMRSKSEKLAEIIDLRFSFLIEKENQRPFEAYRYIDISSGKAQISELAALPKEQLIKGLIGYFQIDAKGVFNSPLLPHASSEISHPLTKLTREAYSHREEIVEECYSLLRDNAFQDTWAQSKQPLVNNYQQLLEQPSQYESLSKLGRSALSSIASKKKVPEKEELEEYVQQQDLVARKMEEAPQQSYLKSKFSKSNQKLSELKLDNRLQQRAELPEVAPSKVASTKQRSRQSELNVLLEGVMQESEVLEEASEQDKESRTITAFAGEVDPFRFEVLDSGEFVFFRNVWKSGQRIIQGFLVNPDVFFDQMIERPLQSNQLNGLIRLVAGLNETVMYSTGLEKGFKPDLFLLRHYVSSPFQKLELIFSLPELPSHSGQQLLNMIVVLFLGVLGLGTWGIYRIGNQQIDLAQQHHDFVASVSHELKTPLTSIRMYGEMLRSNWVDEEKKKSYYDFIFYESERLSRLINNVLQLSKLSNPKTELELGSFGPVQLLDLVQSKISTQVEASGFELELNKSDLENEISLKVNEDAFSQIMINLVDNAIKFSKDFSPKKIEVGYRVESTKLYFYVSDYGPGISKEQEKKIFELFYRSENELTRKTQGTGIGLALVWELAHQMNGEVKLQSKDQGLEVRLYLDVIS